VDGQLSSHREIRMVAFQLILPVLVGIAQASEGDADLTTETVFVDLDGWSHPTTEVADYPHVEYDDALVQLRKSRYADSLTVSAGLDSQDRVLFHASTLKPGDFVPVSIELTGGGFDFSIMRAADRAERGVVVQSLLDQRELAINGVRAKLAAIKAQDVSYFWLNNTFSARVPADSLSDILEWSEVEGIGEAGYVVAPLAYDGIGIKGGTEAQTAINFGHDGREGAISDGQQVIIGVIEPPEDDGTANRISRNHVGWKNCSGCSSRLVLAKTWACTSISCATETTNATTTNHGTKVAWAAFGDIRDGQDSNITNTTERARRSGVAEEAWGTYYRMNTGVLAELTRALETAILDVVDVVNMSFGVAAVQCDRTFDSDGVNAALRNAAATGIVLVGAAGNSGSTGGCTLNYPNYRPEVLTTSALHTGGATPPTYDNTVLRSSSSIGPMSIRVNGTLQSTNGVKLSAPGCYSHFFTHPSGYSTLLETCGTSMAAPVVAGLAGLMRNAFYKTGFSFSAGNAFRLQAAMLVGGDRWNGLSNLGKVTTTANHRTGFGRAKGRYLSPQVSPKAWGLGSTTVTMSGATIPINSGVALPSGATQAKAVILWNEDSLDNVSDIIIRLRDTCANTILSDDISFNMNKRVSISSGAAGRCLALEIVPLHFATGTSRVVYFAHNFHGGTAQ